MKLPYMKLWIGDWTADTLHFDATDAGAYQFLIVHAWRNGGMIRTEDLHAVSRCPSRLWPGVKARIARAFDVVSIDGFWLHQRVMSELRSATEKSEKNRKSALHMQSKRRANAQANAERTHTQLQSELVRTKTVTVEPDAVARSNGSDGAGSPTVEMPILSYREEQRLLEAYRRQRKAEEQGKHS